MVQQHTEFIVHTLNKHGLIGAKQDVLNTYKTGFPGPAPLGGGTSIYPNSLYAAEGATLFIGSLGGYKLLFLVSDRGFPGEIPGTREVIGGIHVLSAEINWETYQAVQHLVPFIRPVSLRRERTTLGCGDRLGLATAGHIRAARAYEIHPVLAQQSIRELNLTGRTYRDVVSDAAFLVLQEGFERGYGADGDHLKTLNDIGVALDAEMPMITLDLTEQMNPQPASWDDEKIAREFSELPDSVTSLVRDRYAGKTFPFPSGDIAISDTEAKRCALMYWKAMDFTGEVDEFLRSKRGDSYDLEVSIDETTAPTVPAHHLFIASELQRRNVTVNSLAPRFIGEFQKGVDYIGDTDEFERQFASHCDIAKAYGKYKISIHSGSDKFSVYPIIGRMTGHRVHVKTAGTSWLEALRTVAHRNSTLFRSIVKKAYTYFPEAQKLYHITADLNKIPVIEAVSDADLPKFLDEPESRQLLHITYGGLLNDSEVRGDFFTLLEEYEQLHYRFVESHMEKHITTLGVPKQL